MSSYVNILGDLPRHECLIIKELPIRDGRFVTIEFEDECIITNCHYRLDEEMFGGMYIIKSLVGNVVTFEIVGDDEDLYALELRNAKVGDKMWFHSKFPLMGEYHNGRDFKYVEL